ncbi:centromeric protein E [Apiospora arundinis]
MIHDKNDRYYLIPVARSRQEVMNHPHVLLYAFEHFVLATSGPRAAEERGQSRPPNIQGAIRENADEKEIKFPPAPDPSLASSVVGESPEDLKEDQGEDRPCIIQGLGRRSKKDNRCEEIEEAMELKKEAVEAIGKDEDSLSMTDFVLTIARVQLVLKIVVPRLPGAYDTSELSTINHSVRGFKAHESGKPITVAYNNSVAKLNELIKNIEKPKTVVLRLPGAYEMAELSTIDRLVRRYRGMKDLPGYRGMNLEEQVALYPEVKLLECMKDHPAYDAMVNGMRPERDPKDDEVSKVGDFHQSDDDAPTLQTWWSQANYTTDERRCQARNAPRGAGQREKLTLIFVFAVGRRSALERGWIQCIAKSKFPATVTSVAPPAHSKWVAALSSDVFNASTSSPRERERSGMAKGGIFVGAFPAPRPPLVRVALHNVIFDTFLESRRELAAEFTSLKTIDGTWDNDPLPDEHEPEPPAKSDHGSEPRASILERTSRTFRPLDSGATSDQNYLSSQANLRAPPPSPIPRKQRPFLLPSQLKDFRRQRRFSTMETPFKPDKSDANFDDASVDKGKRTKILEKET